MKVRLQSYPDLDGVTLVETGEQPITVVLEVPQYFAKERWEVTVWHSTDENEWCALDLQLLAGEQCPVDLQADLPDLARLSFQGALSFKKSIKFTIKFRHGNNQPWVWVRDEYGLGDGHIVSITARSAMHASDIVDLIPNLNKEWTVTSLLSQSPETKLWSLEADIPASKNDTSAYRDLDIGTPFGAFHKWFAMVRNSDPWLAPRKGASQLSLDKDAMICSFQNKEGQNLVLMGVSGVDDVQSMFRSPQPDCISVHGRNDATVEQKMMILVSEGSDFERALASVIYHARSLVWRVAQQKTDPSKLESIPGEPPALQAEESKDRKAQWYDRWYDGLGYCTWNSLGPDLTEDRILGALDKLAENNIHITNLIIDDNWQSIDNGSPGHGRPGWLEFEANKKGFPKGLHHAVSKIRSQHRSIEHVGVWHALLGYWGGISPEGAIAKNYRTTENILDNGDRMTVIAKDDISKYYDDFYSFLIQSGIDLVKTDAQCLLDNFENASGRRELTNAYLDKWAVASLRHFGRNAISCMSQFPQAIVHAHMPQIRPPVVMRNSDDYFPNEEPSHRWHVWANAHNAMLTQYLNVIPDWDMFQTLHKYGHYHAAARSISGGPIYITDQPGHHDVSVIDEMIATSPQGRTVVLRPSVIGRALDPYLDYNADRLLQIGGYHGNTDTGTSMISVFQTSDARNCELIPLTKFPGVTRTGQYLVRAYSTGKVSPVPMAEGVTPLVLASAGEHGYEIYSVFYMQLIQGKTGAKIAVANLGLVNKMAGCAAVLSSDVKSFDNGRITITTKLKGLGVLGIYISALPNMTIDGDFMATLADEAVPRHAVKVSEEDERVLEIDVFAAWKAMGPERGWTNEIEVKVFFHA